MTLNQRYKLHNRPKSNKSILIYFCLFIVLFFSTSFSRYLSNFEGTLGIEFANWSIKVNDVQITQDTKTLNNQIDLVVIENKTDDGLIKPGQKGYFDISIDPQYTEVSLKYKITLDTSNLPEEIQITKYSLNNFNTKINMPSNKIFEGNILLNEKDCLENSEKKIYRIYWEWPSSNAKIDEIKENYKITADIEIEQLLD